MYRSDYEHAEIEYVFLLLVDHPGENARIVAQAQQGIDVMDLPSRYVATQWKKWYKKLICTKPRSGFMMRSELYDQHEMVIEGHHIRLNNLGGKECHLVSKFRLNIRTDQIHLIAMVRSIVCYRTWKHSMDHDTLRGFILLTALDSRERGIVRNVLHDMMQPSKLEVFTNLNPRSTFDSVSSLAAYIVAAYLRRDSGDTLNDSESENPWAFWDDVDFYRFP